ncbi:adhesion G protein-coupled receptor E1-like [Dasypus novemcinctus]|uniref:adhesion G protein-coupled receptor E1-like n=1 Tax=Dasypus novemcinctus TaxID=9361 RepID=UPI00265E0ACE|nr:adhesion G protein-coupled receptor E1-like [Dasypus novemcinctus]
MGSRCLVLLSGVSVLLALSSSEVKNSGAFCPPCPKNAGCHNRTHCACHSGFQSMSGKKYFMESSEKCEDIDECKSGMANCKGRAYCKNTDGSFYCSCIITYPIFNWVADIFNFDQPECYEDTSEILSSSSGKFLLEILRNRTHNDNSTLTSQPSQHVDLIIRNVSLVSTGNHLNAARGKGIPFRSKGNMTSRNKLVQRCQEKAVSDSYCGLMSSTFSIVNDAWKTTTSSLKETAKHFGGVLKERHTWSKFSKEETSLLGTFLLESVESTTLAAFLKPSANASQSIQTEYLDIESKVIKEECTGENITFNLKAKGDAMKIGCSTVQESQSSGALAVTTGVAFASFEGMESVLDERFFQDPQDPLANSKRKLKMNSRIVRGIMTGEKKDGFSDPVIYTLENIQPKQKSESPICVSWDTDVEGGRWTSLGCEVLNVSETHTICSCKRLANLAIIMASVELTMEYSLSIISHVGLVISLVCLVCAIATFLLCRSIRNHNTDLHLHLCVCLFLAKILFLTGVNRTKKKLGCAIIAGFLHYLFLACFFWMLVEAVMLFLMVRNLKVVNYFSSRNVKMRHLCVIGYGLPGLVVLVSASVQPKGYGMHDRCWLSTESGFIWSFLGPVCTIIMINSILLTWTLMILRQKLSSVSAEVSTIKDTRLLTFKAFAQVFILGCSWVLGIFQIGAMARVMAYLFTIINSLQGAFIFLIHCLLSRQVREEYRRWFTAKTKPSSQSQTSGIVLSSVPSSSKTG